MQAEIPADIPLSVTPRDERLGCALAFAVAAVIAGLAIWQLWDLRRPALIAWAKCFI